MPDVYGRKPVEMQKPVTADQCTMIWGGAASVQSKVVTTATQVTVQYQQQVTRRRTLGGTGKAIAVTYPSYPVGSIQIQQLVSELSDKLFEMPGWNVCKGNASIDINFDGSSAFDGCTSVGPKYVCIGGVVTNFGFSAEAESLVVTENVSVEFLQLMHG